VNLTRNFGIWAGIILVLVLLFNLFDGNASSSQRLKLSYSDLLAQLRQSQVSEILIKGNQASGKLSDGRAFTTYLPEDPTLAQRLSEAGVRVSAEPEESGNSFLSILFAWLPVLLLFGVSFIFFRQMQSGSGRAMGFGKSRAKLLTEKKRAHHF
jgi:cell division protease FtsH